MNIYTFHFGTKGTIHASGDNLEDARKKAAYFLADRNLVSDVETAKGMLYHYSNHPPEIFIAYHEYHYSYKE
jgi:hypothetical protein